MTFDALDKPPELRIVYCTCSTANKRCPTCGQLLGKFKLAARFHVTTYCWECISLIVWHGVHAAINEKLAAEVNYELAEASAPDAV